MNYLRLIRWQNLLFLGLLVWLMEKWVCTPVLSVAGFGEVMPWWVLCLLLSAVVCTGAAGYIINDYFDVKIDRINRPDRLIVTRTVSKEQAMWLYRILAGAGIVFGLAASWVVRNWPLATIFLITPGLLWFYSSSYKRQLFLGNLIVSLVSALPPLLVGLTNVALLNRQYPEIISFLTINRELILWTAGFSLFAFLLTWIREIVKDLQDQNGDRELECHTMPIVFGVTWTKVFVTILIVATAGLLCYFGFVLLPFPHTWNSLSTRYLVFGLLVPLACELALLWAARIPSDYRHAQLLMKFIMFLGMLFSFVICRLF